MLLFYLIHHVCLIFDFSHPRWRQVNIISFHLCLLFILLSHFCLPFWHCLSYRYIPMDQLLKDKNMTYKRILCDPIIAVIFAYNDTVIFFCNVPFKWQWFPWMIQLVAVCSYTLVLFDGTDIDVYIQILGTCIYQLAITIHNALLK